MLLLERANIQYFFLAAAVESFSNVVVSSFFYVHRCTVKSACQKATTSSPRWLAYGSGQQCIDFEQVLPDRIPIAQTAVVSFFFFSFFIVPRKRAAASSSSDGSFPPSTSFPEAFRVF